MKLRTFSDSPRNLFANEELAKELLSIVSEFGDRLIPFVEKVQELEATDEYEKVAKAVGYVLCEIGDRLLYPVYRRHKELIPDQLKGELL